MYKLVTVDLDGTLLNSYGEVTENTKEKIKKTQEKGVEIMIASGRPIDSIKTIAEEINSKKYFIAGNGAIIYDIQKEKIIYEKYIPRQKIIEIAKICEENNISYNIYTEKNIITQDLKYNVLYYYKENLKKDANKITSIIKVDSILEYVKNEPNIKCLKITVCDENQTIFKSIVRRLRAIENIDVMDVSHMSRKVFKQGTEDIEIGYFYTEISSTQVNKWQAIKYLLPILQIKPEEVIGIGDNINDKEMIENAGLGVCMGQSTPVIKEISDEITDSNTEEGVANVLEKIFLQSN
ncbi:MAG: hypothetical protein BHW01_01280 [Clostridium sp. 27_14]|nr:MAG: hypothetical protein BHW01_01280 [Clostridium sp. 27_14]